MINTIYEVTFKDGRLYRVACANRSQELRFVRARRKVIDKITHTSCKTSGVHNIKEFEQIVENEQI